MFTNGNISKGLNAQEPLEIAERIYLFNQGDNEINMTECWSSKGYSLNNGIFIQDGTNLRQPFSGGYISVEKSGYYAQILGTQKPVPANTRRFLVVEGWISEEVQNQNAFAIILSRQKELAYTGGSTRYYNPQFKEQKLKFYIDISELGWDRMYIAIGASTEAGKMIGEGQTLFVSKVYLTDERYKSVVPLYNRGNDYSEYVTGQEYGTLVGWEAYTPGSGEESDYETPTFGSEYIELKTVSSNTKCRAVTSNLVDLTRIRQIGVLMDVVSIPSSGTPQVKLIIGERTFAQDITYTGDNIIMYTYEELVDPITGRVNLSPLTIGIETTGLLDVKVLAAWIEQ